MKIPQESRPDQMASAEDAPVLAAFRYTNDHRQSWLVVWCQHCDRWHAHGTVGPRSGQGDGHRVAHCVPPESPYHRTGYKLWEMGPISAQLIEERERLARRRRKGSRGRAA